MKAYRITFNALPWSRLQDKERSTFRLYVKRVVPSTIFPKIHDGQLILDTRPSHQIKAKII